MNVDVYIVKQGTPESKLLSRAGFDRAALSVAQWRGRRRSKGGFGRAPVAWRVEGENNVRKLCLAIVDIIGQKSDLNLTAEERSALRRAENTIKALSNRGARVEAVAAVTVDRGKIIRLMLSRRFPCASATEIDSTSGQISQAPPNSFEELQSKLHDLLGTKLFAWKEGVYVFVQTMKVD